MATTTVLDRFRLDGKVAIVTGASSGLGVAFGRALAEAGADLVLAARRVDRLGKTRTVVEERGRRALTVAADLAQPEDAQAVVDAAMNEFGHVDVLVNNAGKGTAVPATRETPEQFREVIDINLNGCYWMAQACGRVMGPGSAIINVASVVALTSDRLPQAAYSASKFGVIGLTRASALDYADKGIRINAVCPGIIGNTPMATRVTKNNNPDIIRAFVAAEPIGRLGEPDEIAAAVLWLCSPAASFVIGHSMAIDGGILA